MRTFLALLGLSLGAPAFAGVSERAYDRAVDLVDRLYLYPGEIDSADLLRAAAQGLAEEVDWLIVEPDGNAVHLRHGDGTSIGQVSVGSMDTLPQALLRLEGTVADAGYPLGNVDVRLELLKGMTNAMDRYTRVLAGERLERFDVRLKGTLVGVGAKLSIVDDRLVVRELVPGGPAEAGGLHAGDIIQRIDGVSTTNMPLREATRRVQGSVDTRVLLEVERGGQVLELDLRRAEVVVANVEHKVLEGGIGYVSISHFSQRTVENLIQALGRLRIQRALGRGLVIDLRGNTGGSMKEAARSADLFLEDGMLLRTAGPDGGRVQNLQGRMDAEDTDEEPQVPIVLLVDAKTASGSEILAGALVELERAAVLGARTYGKGTVQKIYSLDDEARLKLTVAQYLLSGDRVISGAGIVPDVAMADIRLDSYGVRYEDWERTGVAWDDIVPAINELESWRGHTRDESLCTPSTLDERGRCDLRLELARRAVVSSEGWKREDTVAALRREAETIREVEGVHLAEALEAKQIDWSPAEEDGGVPDVDVVIRARPWAEGSDTIEVEVEVENLGAEPLHRTLVELECATFSAWDGLVVPVGLVPANERLVGKVRVPLKPGVSPREDDVTLRLRTDRRPSLRVGNHALAAASSALPRVAVDVHLEGEGPERRAEVMVRNLSPGNITGVEVYFSHPGDIDVELIDRASRLSLLGGRDEARFDLDLRVGEDAPATIPLELVIESEKYDKLAEWRVNVPLDGSVVSVEPPEVTFPRAPLSAHVGSLTLPVLATDRDNLDHVVVFANGEKIAWAAGGDARTELKARVSLREGANRIVAIAEDKSGLRTRETIVVRGTPIETVDAEELDAP